MNPLISGSDNCAELELHDPRTATNHHDVNCKKNTIALLNKHLGLRKEAIRSAETISARADKEFTRPKTFLQQLK